MIFECALLALVSIHHSGSFGCEMKMATDQETHTQRLMPHFHAGVRDKLLFQMQIRLDLFVCCCSTSIVEALRQLLPASTVIIINF